MRLTPTITATALALSLIATTSVYAAERIKFARNTVSTMVTGNLQSFNSKRTYVIKLKAGQQFDIRQTPNARHPITISVKDPYGRSINDWAADCHSYHNSITRLSGDYHITVTECKKADEWQGKFVMNVTAL